MIDLRLGDCLDVMRTLPDNSIDAVVTDPPYYNVKSEHWDRQWGTPQKFLDWLDTVAAEWQRILKPNGSLYCFASPRMSARVEVMLGARFNVLNRIRWIKEAGWHNKTDKEQLRTFLSPYEEIIFCEHYGADNIAKGEAGYAAKCDELRGFIFEPLRKYLSDEWNRAGLKYEQANEACGTASMAGRHFFSVSQWCLPTKEHYLKLREYAHTHNHGGEYLRRDYEDLRRDYEDLRRPFAVTKDVPYTDVWTFETVAHYPGKHPCEKPQKLLQHIIRTSTREGATVLDCFAGTGNTGLAAFQLGRNAILIEREADYLAIAQRRIEAAQAQMQMEI